MMVRLYGQLPTSENRPLTGETVRGPTTDDRRFSVHANTRGRRQHVARTPRGHARRAAVVLGLVVAACSNGPGAGPGGVDPTFSRAAGASLAFEEPVATVSGLVPPTAEGEPWTIVGSTFDPEADTSVASVWTAGDARSWERSSVTPASKGVGESMAAAVAVDGRVLAVGQIGDGAQSDAAIWRLTDGEWAQSQPAALGGDHEQWAFDVATGEGGTVIAGGENAWGEVRARLWFSADGKRWKSVDGGPGGPFDATGEESVRDVAAVGTGFVAVGSRKVDNEQDGVAWYSPDGTSWEQLDAPSLGGPGRQELLAVASTGQGVVAGGYADNDTGQGQAVAWRSADGRSWEPAIGPLPLNADPRNAASDLAVHSLSVDDQGILAAGGSAWRPHLWRSADGGVTWSALPNPVNSGRFEDGVALGDAGYAGGVTVALGAEPSVLILAGPRWEDATNDAFPKGGAQPFASAVALGADATIAAGGRHTAPTGTTREQYTGLMWRRENNGDWQALKSDQLAVGQVMDIVPFAGGFAAVGVEDFGLAAKREVVSDMQPDGLVWVSRDGKDWARVGVANVRINDAWLEHLDDPDPATASIIAQMEAGVPPETQAPAGGPGTRSLSAAAALDKGFIAVGSVYESGNADPIVVVSPDGTSLVGETPVSIGPEIQRYDDVCVAPDGTAVAVGISGSAEAYDVIVGRRAPDATWSAGTADNGSFAGGGSQYAYSCAASDEGFVIVGSDDRSGDADARIWTSSDGLTWAQLDSGLLGGSGDQWASAVAAVPDGGWLVGGTDTIAGDGDIALWRVSKSGDVTRRDRGEPALAGPGEQSMTNLAVDERGHVTLVGEDYGRVGLWESDRLDR
jgi:hypothetical protein